MAPSSQPDEVYGPLFDSGRIELAALATLKKWLDAYLDKACTEANHGPIVGIKSWAVESEYDRFPEQGLPALIIMAPHMTGPPEKTGGGFYRAEWQLNVAVEVAAATGRAARRMAQIYGAAVRGALMQRRDLGDAAQVSDWMGEGAETISSESRRTRVAVENLFVVERRDALNTLMGPGTDEPPGPDQLPEITDVEVEANPRG